MMYVAFGEGTDAVLSILDSSRKFLCSYNCSCFFPWCQLLHARTKLTRAPILSIFRCGRVQGTSQGSCATGWYYRRQTEREAGACMAEQSRLSQRGFIIKSVVIRV